MVTVSPIKFTGDASYRVGAAANVALSQPAGGHASDPQAAFRKAGRPRRADQHYSRAMASAGHSRRNASAGSIIDDHIGLDGDHLEVTLNGPQWVAIRAAPVGVVMS